MQSSRRLHKEKGAKVRLVDFCTCLLANAVVRLGCRLGSGTVVLTVGVYWWCQSVVATCGAYHWWQEVVSHCSLTFF